MLNVKVDWCKLAEREVAWLRPRGLQDADVEDARQEAALRAWRASAKLTVGFSHGEALAYVAKAGRSAAIDYLRARAVRLREVPVAVDDRDLWGRGPTPDQILDARTAGRRIQAVLDLALSRMTVAQRALVQHRMGLQSLPPDVAALPSGTRGQYMHRARYKLLVASEELQCQDLLDDDAIGAFLRS